jgi:hypothetical protein
VKDEQGMTKSPIGAALALLFAVLLALQLGNAEPGLLYLAPALLLLTALALGRYPGERLLLVAADPWRRSLRRQAPPVPLWHLSALAVRPRGGALLGCALAGRAPPR